MNLWQNYVRPSSISEAIAALTSPPGPAIPLAGGTDLLLDLEQGRHSPVHTLVDLTTVAEMQVLELRGEELFIGGAIPLNHIARHPLVMKHARALVEACDLVGGPQVRNVATLGGNVAHALPAADGTIALLAMDAQGEIASSAGLRRVPFGELFLGPGKSALKHGEELLVGFYLKTAGAANTASCFQRIMRPQGVALPIINLATWVQGEGQTVQDARIAVGPGSSTPFRARTAEAAMREKIFDAAAIDAALEALLQEVKFRSSPRRAGADYRRHLVESLFRETVTLAWRRAQAEHAIAETQS